MPVDDLIPAILYFGYPRDAADIVSGASVENAAWATQEALWRVTDTYDIDQNSLAQELLTYAVTYFSRVPSDFQVEIWEPWDRDKQNIAYVDYFPEIRTTATWKDGSKEITAGPGQEVLDSVEVISDTPGKEYTVQGEQADCRCYDGGTITNYLIPQTGDNGQPLLWAVGAAVALLSLAAILKKKKQSAC